MAPATPATGAAARAAAASPVAASEGSKATARSVGLGVPALPPLPGVGLASHGQPRAAASSCKRPARNVVSTAVGEPATPLTANEDLTEFVNDLKQEWDGIKNKYAVTTVAIAVTLGMWSAGAVVSAIDRLPVVPGLMETVGLGYTGWFAYKNLIFKPDRDAFFKNVREFYDDLISG
ncbi:hypothetical protein QOZ80_2BG0168860 [Eleusine coracana subsp. coracana]|nr:hypothetical protein QOZ80_2BG0168860 [Eleusine coracana subsp. coracana]